MRHIYYITHALHASPRTTKCKFLLFSAVRISMHAVINNVMTLRTCMFIKCDSAYFSRVAAKSSTKRAMHSGSSKWPQCPDFSSHSSLQSQEIADAQKVFISGWLRQYDKPGKAPAALPPKNPPAPSRCAT